MLLHFLFMTPYLFYTLVVANRNHVSEESTCSQAHLMRGGEVSSFTDCSDNH